MQDVKIYQQASANDSPWSTQDRIRMLLWEFSWTVFCLWTPKPANRWRLFWLKLFGAKIYGQPFVHQRARIKIPWHLILHHQACLGDRTNAYSLGVIEVHERATVAQEVYLCTGTHALDRPAMNLITAPITIGPNAFIGARAFIMPGVTVGRQAVVGACSVVTRNVAPYSTVVGTPAQEINKRPNEQMGYDTKST